MSIQVAGKFEPQNLNTWPLLEDKYVQGGYRIVADETERLAMNVLSLKVGQKIYVVSTGKEWRILTVTEQAFTAEEIQVGGGGGEVDPLLLAPAYMGTATSRYDASLQSHSRAVVTSSARIMGFNLPFERSATNLTVLQENHGRSIGERAILRVINGTQVVGLVNAIDAQGFTLTVPDTGPVFGHASYSLGANFFFYKADLTSAATGTGDLRGARGSVPADGEIVVHSVRFRMPPNSRDGTNFSMELPGSQVNGFGAGSSMSDMILPAVSCRSEGAGNGASMTAVGITQTVNVDGVWVRHQSASMPNAAAGVHYALTF